MIINETKVSYEDVKLMCYKQRNRHPFLRSRVILASSGVFCIFTSTKAFIKDLEYYIEYISEYEEIRNSALMLLGVFLLGVLVIISTFFYWKYVAYKAYKKIRNGPIQHIEFNDDVMKITNKQDEIERCTSIKYSIIKSFFLYKDGIGIVINNKTLQQYEYIFVHDDSYISGDAESLISLLSKKTGT